MFLGLAVFAILALVLSIIVIRAVKALFRLLTGGKKDDQKTEEKTQPEKEKAAKSETKDKSEKESVKEVKSESEQLEKSPEVESDPAEDLIRNRYSEATLQGITESFASEGTMMEIDPKTVADLCVGSSGITYLEFNNRELASEDYFGFNLIVEKDSRMVLTYNGQAVASITAVETKATAIINGQEVEGTAPGLRINTFPPHLSPGMVPGDLERMLTAADRIRACGGDARLAADVMVDEFTEPGNISKLKGAIDGKIQSKESARKQTVQHAQERSPKRLSPRQS